ncbi:MAG: hypothetical protein DCC58_19245 [Chloroflexi bacterium]|nr:MAG: hypothetical protein DCC58_19245 [Chloroflexota bacterium]
MLDVPPPQVAERGTTKRWPLLALYAANLVSHFGGNLTYVAIPWFVLQTTGSASKTGMVAVATALPAIIVGMLGGLVVDRYGFKRTSILADILSGVTTASIPLLYHTVGLQFWPLLAIVCLGAVFDIPGYTARASLLPDLARLAGVRLERANAASQTCLRIAQVLGPPAAGVLIALLGTSNVLWIDAATFGVSAAIVALAIPNIRHTSEPRAKGQLAIFSDLSEGLRFIRADQLILAAMVTFALGAMLAEPLYGVILPVYADQLLGSALDLGIIYSALGIGSIAGNIVFATFSYRLPRRFTLVSGWVVRAVSFWIFLLEPRLWTIVVMMVVNGLMFEPTNAIFQTLMQERIPAAMRGRVLGAFTTFAFGAMPLGLLAYGALIDGIGLYATLVVLAVANVLPALSLFAPWTWNELGNVAPPSADPVPASAVPHD